MNQKDLLSRYKSTSKPLFTSEKKKKASSKKAKTQNILIIDEDDFGNEGASEDEGARTKLKSVWSGNARNLQMEEEELEDEKVQAEVDHEENFKTNFTASNWNNIGEAKGGILKRSSGALDDSDALDDADADDEEVRSEEVGHDAQRGRRRSSPSLSPTRMMNRRSSPSPSPKRNSRKSPSLSPERSSGRRRSSPSPDHNAEQQHGGGIKMSDGTSAGLQSAQAIKEQITAQREREMRSIAQSAINPAEQQTVYRDTKTGKKVDLAARQQEMDVFSAQEAEKERQQKKWGQGLVQAKEAELQRKRLVEEKSRGLAVYADDQEHNDQLREKVRWGDTMAAHVSSTAGASTAAAGGGKRGKRVMYKGPPPAPNRYGILPGYRWDGVDRGNGFELKVHRAKHIQIETKKEYNRWAMEDM